jgi:hypothetical protein
MTHALSRLRFSALAANLLLAACTAENNPGGTGGSSGSGGSSASGGRGGSSAGRGGSSATTAGAGGSASATGGTGGSTSSGGTTGGTGTGGSAGTGGSMTTGGSGGSAGTDGNSGTGGSGGAGGMGDAKPADSAGEAPASGGVALAGKLHRYVRTLRCVRPNPQDTRRSCFCSDADANKHDVLTFGGDPSVTYDVTIHVRGNVEPRGYTGGALQDPANLWFYVGGMPGGPNDNRLYNQYKILVSDPKQVYYLNANSRGVLPSSSKDHDTWKIDYTAKLKIKGGAMVDVANEDLPSGMNANFLNVKVEGVPPDLVMQEPMGFPGQFFYVEVDSVVPAP